jgi:hypothetical protein
LSKDVTKEEITVLTEIFRLGAILTLAVSGGTISLILGERTTLKNTFAWQDLLLLWFWECCYTASSFTFAA